MRIVLLVLAAVVTSASLAGCGSSGSSRDVSRRTTTTLDMHALEQCSGERHELERAVHRFHDIVGHNPTSMRDLLRAHDVATGAGSVEVPKLLRANPTYWTLARGHTGTIVIRDDVDVPVGCAL